MVSSEPGPLIHCFWHFFDIISSYFWYYFGIISSYFSLLNSGQFGTRTEGGKNAASARYIFTCLSPVTRTLFHSLDDVVCCVVLCCVVFLLCFCCVVLCCVVFCDSHTISQPGWCGTCGFCCVVLCCCCVFVVLCCVVFCDSHTISQPGWCGMLCCVVLCCCYVFVVFLLCCVVVVVFLLCCVVLCCVTRTLFHSLDDVVRVGFALF